MTTDRIRDAIQAQPFEPFRMNLADGRSLLVHQPETIAATGGGCTVIVNDPFGESAEMIDRPLVTNFLRCIGTVQTA